VLPMVTKLFKNFGYFVFAMPVTSLENQLRGNKIWGLPKVTREIDIFEDGGDCVTIAKEDDGKPYLEIRVPTSGDATPFDETSNLYTKLGDKLLQSETNFKATFNVTKHMDALFKKGMKPDRQYLKIGDGPSAKLLRTLGIEEQPFQFRFAKHMNACFDLSNPDYRSPIRF
jgi:hypothetical protein